MAFQAGHREGAPGALELIFLPVEEINERMVDEDRLAEVDCDMRIPRNAVNDPLMAEDIGENGRALDGDSVRAAVLLDAGLNLEQVAHADAPSEVKNHFDNNTRCHAEQQVFEKRDKDGDDENDELFLADFVDVLEFLRRGQTKSRINQHRCEEENTVEKVGPFGFHTESDVRAAADHLRNHGEAAEEAGERIAGCKAGEVGAGIGLAPKRIQTIDRLHRQKRLQTIDKQKHKYIHPEGKSNDCAELSPEAQAAPEIPNCHQRVRKPTCQLFIARSNHHQPHPQRAVSASCHRFD